ncbi:hypothetical protein FAGKG844_500006 [Frankia sp. AgKG'84/4]
MPRADQNSGFCAPFTTMVPLASLGNVPFARSPLIGGMGSVASILLPHMPPLTSTLPAGHDVTAVAYAEGAPGTDTSVRVTRITGRCAVSAGAAPGAGAAAAGAAMATVTASADIPAMTPPRPRAAPGPPRLPIQFVPSTLPSPRSHLKDFGHGNRPHPQ